MDGYLLSITKLMCRQSLGCITHQAMWGRIGLVTTDASRTKWLLHDRKTRRWLFRLDYASVFASITGSTTLDPAPQIWCAQIQTFLPWPSLSHGLPPTASRSKMNRSNTQGVWEAIQNWEKGVAPTMPDTSQLFKRHFQRANVMQRCMHKGQNVSSQVRVSKCVSA